ncbi:site-specific recombinase resolvase [Methylolobus aquaticus]|nr:site-specific recombinase resolvase [Methylolobus aquaticus]
MKRQTLVPFGLRRRQSQLVNTAQPAHDPGLLASIGRALYWQQLLDAGVVASFSELAEREGLTKPSVSHVLRLACLAPELVERCLAGQQPRTLTQRSLKRNPLPDDWDAQRDVFARFE